MTTFFQNVLSETMKTHDGYMPWEVGPNTAEIAIREAQDQFAKLMQHPSAVHKLWTPESYNGRGRIDRNYFMKMVGLRESHYEGKSIADNTVLDNPLSAEMILKCIALLIIANNDSCMYVDEFMDRYCELDKMSYFGVSCSICEDAMYVVELLKRHNDVYGYLAANFTPEARTLFNEHFSVMPTISKGDQARLLEFWESIPEDERDEWEYYGDIYCELGVVVSLSFYKK